MKTKTMFGVVLAAALSPGVALAQGADAPPLPSGTVKPQTATSGSTEIAKGGFVTGTAPPEEEEREATEASIAAGGLFSSGNARTVALTSTGKFRLRRDDHQLSVQAAANFARAGKKDEPVETTVENYQGLVRYDYFFSEGFAGFFQTTARRDRFQGLWARFNFDPGAAYYFIDTKKHQLRGEIGYDLQHDIRRNAARVVEHEPPEPGAPAPPPTLLDKTQTLHNVRAFLGYENKLYKEVGLTTSFEYIQNVSDLGTYRLVFDVGLTTNIADNLAIATTYTMRFENKPLPDIEKADSIASVNLVFTLF